MIRQTPAATTAAYGWIAFGKEGAREAIPAQRHVSQCTAGNAGIIQVSTYC